MMNEWISKMDIDALSFFSEEAIDKWLIEKKIQNSRIGVQLLKMLAIVMGSGTALSVLIAEMFGGSTRLVYFVLVEIIFFMIFTLTTFSSFVHFIKEASRDINGTWFIETSCKCQRTSFDKITKKESTEIRKNENNLLDINGEPKICGRCKREIKIKKMWLKHIDKKKYHQELNRIKAAIKEEREKKKREARARDAIYKERRVD